MLGLEEHNDQQIINTHLSFLSHQTYPCVAAREAAVKEQVVCFVSEEKGQSAN